MLHAWSNSNIEVWRSVSPLTMAAGLAGGRRLAVLGLLGWFLLVGWAVLAAGGAWEAAWQDSPFSAFGAASLSVAASSPSFDFVTATSAG